MKYKLTMEEARKIANIKAISRFNLNVNSGTLYQDIDNYCAEYDKYMMYLIDNNYVNVDANEV